MSFVRVRKTSASGVPRKRRLSKKKPAWDDTVQDLTKFKASAEEIEQRKLAHQSKFALASRLKKQHHASRGGNHVGISMSNAEARQLAIMKEVLYDQQQFHEVLSKSDKMMDVVKDLFGDDPKRYTGFPQVTTAPNNEDGDRTDSLVAPLPDFQTRMEALSDSVMDQSALNDLLNPQSDSEDDGEVPEPITYQPKMNMQRFQQFLAAEEKNNTLSTISGQAHLSHMDQGPVQSTRIQETQSLQTTQENTFTTPPKNGHNESVEILRPPGSAMNDTKKIKKTKKRTVEDNNTSTQQNNSTFQLTDLRKVLEGLENEIAEYERQTGRGPQADKPRQETFSGYTLSLVDSVTKLTRYLKENDIRLRAETTVREQLSQDVSQLTALIDALTSDIIHTQEEYGKLQSEFAKYKQQSQEEISLLKRTLHNAGLINVPNGIQDEEERTPPRQAPEMIKPKFYHADDATSLSGIPSHVNPVSSAVLLSPPVRKTRVQEDEDPQHQHSSLPDTKQANLAANHPHAIVPSNVHPGQPGHTVIYTSGQHAFHPPNHQHTMIPKPVYSQGQKPMQTSHGTQQMSQPAHPDPRVSIHNGVRMLPEDDRHPYTHNQTQKPVPMSSKQPAQGVSHAVSVPRPTPLVQSNVGIEIPPQQQHGLGQLGMAHGSVHSGVRREDKGYLTSQIAELNKQHEEAQRRLQTLMLQQQHQHGQPHVIQEDENLQSIQRPVRQNSVSPPISPISQRSDNFISVQGMSNQNMNFNPRAGRGITVSLPTVDLSLDSTGSPSPR